MLKQLFAGFAAVCALSAAGNLVLKSLHLWINVSDSLPLGLYQSLPVSAHEDALHRGDLVLACLPEDIAAEAFKRGYLTSGSCPASTAPAGKYIAALSGDRVHISAGGVSVNGQMLPHSQLLHADAAGNLLPQPEFDGVLQPDEVLLLNQKLNSFDGRYFGPVRQEQVVARIKPVWLWKQNAKWTEEKKAAGTEKGNAGDDPPASRY